MDAEEDVDILLKHKHNNNKKKNCVTVLWVSCGTPGFTFEDVSAERKIQILYVNHNHTARLQSKKFDYM